MQTTPPVTLEAQPATGVMQQIRILRRELQRYSASVERHFGVTSAQVDFLLELYATPLLRLSDLQNRIGIHQATASNMVAQLLKRGLILKIPHPDDKRAVVLKLSRQGMEFAEATNGLLVLRREWEGHFRNMAPEKLAQVNEVLGDLLGVVSRVSAFCEGTAPPDGEDCNQAAPARCSGPSF